MTQSEALIEILKDYQPHTLPELRTGVERLTGKWATETAVSARWRELKRKGYQTDAQPREKGSNTFLYRFIAPVGQGKLF